MQEIERTLRDTLRILGDPDAPTRQKLYRTTENIFEKNLLKVADADPQMVAQRRQDLKDLITQVEQDYVQTQALDEGPTDRLGNDPIFPDLSPDIKSKTSQSASAHSGDVSWPDNKIDGPDKAHSFNAQDQSQTLSSAPMVASEIRPERGYQERGSSAPSPSIDPPVAADAPKQMTDPASLVSENAQAAPVNSQIKPLKTASVKDKVKTRKKRKRTGLIDVAAGSVVTVILLAFIAGGAWFIVESEYYDMFLEFREGPATAETSVSTIDQENFVPRALSPDNNANIDWVTLFGPNDINNVRGRGEALIEAFGSGNQAGVRLISVTQAASSEVIVPLNSRLLNAGIAQNIVLSLSVSADAPTQIYVRAILRDGVEDTRRRFQLDAGQNDILIEMDMKNVPNFNTQPFLAINSDMSGEGKAINLHQVSFQVLR